MATNELKNYYEVLEIPYNAKAEEIYHSYQRAKIAYSNDSVALYSLISADECRNILSLIEEAYSILSDPTKRRLYDEARGIKQDYYSYGHTSLAALARETFSTANAPQAHGAQAFKKNEVSTLDSSNATDSTSSTNMNKLVAQKKFALDYVVNSDFEKEIEETQDFSGEFLKKIREYKNLTIERLADLTKVSPMNLRMIEEESFSKLPAPVYVRGFVFQYAKCLKLKPELVANSYVARMKAQAK